MGCFEKERSSLLQLGSTEMHSNITEPIAKTMIQEDFKDRLNVERQVRLFSVLANGKVLDYRRRRF